MTSSALTSTSKILNMPSAANSLLLKIYFFFLLIFKCIFLKLFFSLISIIVPLYFYIFLRPYLTNYTNYIISACILLRLELNHLSIETQQEILKPLNAMPFQYRLFYRFSLFSHKILNKFFLLNISNLLKNV